MQTNKLLISIFTFLTGFFHLAVGLVRISEDTLFGVLFILNGIGFLGLLVAYLVNSILPDKQEIIKQLLGYLALATIASYFIWWAIFDISMLYSFPSAIFPYVIKLFELMIFILLRKENNE
ncbi:MAG: hypothetical protein OEY49_00405 [Candidatus Heimdallarchaeota archaeon]|nr:hypothetical protein [Candidatus Heimdallarchaeota archaeon]